MATWDVDVTCVDGVDEDTEFNPESCETVEGTLDIHWEAVGGAYAPCVITTISGTSQQRRSKSRSAPEPSNLPAAPQSFTLLAQWAHSEVRNTQN